MGGYTISSNGHWRTAITSWIVAVGCAAWPVAAAEPQRLPIFDAHLHYSDDAWDKLPPQQAVALRRQAGLKYAMVSSSGDDGTQMLHAAARPCSRR